MCSFSFLFFFFKQKTAYEMRISDWSSDVCSSDLTRTATTSAAAVGARGCSGATSGASSASPAATPPQRTERAMPDTKPCGTTAMTDSSPRLLDADKVVDVIERLRAEHLDAIGRLYQKGLIQQSDDQRLLAGPTVLGGEIGRAPV